MIVKLLRFIVEKVNQFTNREECNLTELNKPVRLSVPHHTEVLRVVVVSFLGNKLEAIAIITHSVYMQMTCYNVDNTHTHTHTRV